MPAGFHVAGNHIAGIESVFYHTDHGSTIEGDTMHSFKQSSRTAAIAILASICGLAFAADDEVTGQKIKAGTDTGKSINVTQSQLTGSEGQSKDWLHTNGGYAQTRFYPGQQINAGNVKNLKTAFMFQTEVRESMETAPIVVDGIM